MALASRCREIYSQQPERQSFTYLTVVELTVAAKLLTYIREVHVSNLGGDTDCFDGFSAFIHTLQANTDRHISSNMATTASAHILSSSIFINHPIIRRYIQSWSVS
jgi:hypothetical protein